MRDSDTCSYTLKTLLCVSTMTHLRAFTKLQKKTTKLHFSNFQSYTTLVFFLIYPQIQL